MPAPILRIRRLQKVYRIGSNALYALNDVDLDIYRGEFCCIVGKSGSGKSTLLNMMAGLEKPTKGVIEMAGQRIERYNEARLVKYRLENVGFIFQSFNLFASMTALENVTMPLVYRGMARKKRERMAAAMLKRVGLESHMKHRPTQMSGGQQQRVGIARALVTNAPILFADEPTGNLDSKTSEEIMGILQQVVRDTGHTLIMVTHDNEIARYADRIVHITDGRITSVEYHGVEVPPIDAPPPDDGARSWLGAGEEEKGAEEAGHAAEATSGAEAAGDTKDAAIEGAANANAEIASQGGMGA